MSGILAMELTEDLKELNGRMDQAIQQLDAKYKKAAKPVAVKSASTTCVYIDGPSKKVGPGYNDQISALGGELRTAEDLIKMGYFWSGNCELKPRIEYLKSEIDRLEKLRGKKVDEREKLIAKGIISPKSAKEVRPVLTTLILAAHKILHPTSN